MPSPYTLFRRIGSMRTNASSQWTSFVQMGDEFLWVNVTTADVNGSALSTTSTLFTLTVPTGLQVVARLRGWINATPQTDIIVTAPDEGIYAYGTPSSFITARNIASSLAAFTLDVRTNTSAQVRAVADSATSVWMGAYGWYDRRGRD
jgi:hypothetical protein